MIPKLIHYCWFGKKTKPKSVLDKIDTWKKYMPDYKIIEWNEENFPVNYNNYTLQAYKKKKYAFVSDVARIYALEKYGGVYLDTDIEVLKNFSCYLTNSVILAYESSTTIMTGFLAGEANHIIWKELLKSYARRSFIDKEGKEDCTPNTVYITDYLKKNGYISGQKILDLVSKQNNLTVYDTSLFGAFDADNSRVIISDDTVLVHYCFASWKPIRYRVFFKLQKFAAQHFSQQYDTLKIIYKKLTGRR